MAGEVVYVPDVYARLASPPNCSVDNRDAYMAEIVTEYDAAAAPNMLGARQRWLHWKKPSENALRGTKITRRSPAATRSSQSLTIRSDQLVPYIDWSPFFQLDLAGRYPAILQNEAG